MKEIDQKMSILFSAGIIFGLSVYLYKSPDAVIKRLTPILAGVVTSAAFIGAYFTNACSIYIPAQIDHQELILKKSIIAGLVVGSITELSFQNPFFTFLMTFCTSSAISYYGFNSLDANNTKSENNKSTTSAKVGDSIGDKMRDATSAKIGDSIGDKMQDATSAKVGDSIGDKMRNATSAKVGDSIGDKMLNATSAKIGDSIGDKMLNATSAKAREAIGEEEIVTHLDYTEQESFETNKLLQKI